jgi:hypothetical protein
VFNVDGTANEAGSILEVVELIIRYDGHSEHALFSVTSLGRQNMILGITWLRENNLVIESPVRSGYLPFLALTETLTGYNIFPISE